MSRASKGRVVEAITLMPARELRSRDATVNTGVDRTDAGWILKWGGR